MDRGFGSGRSDGGRAAGVFAAAPQPTKLSVAALLDSAGRRSDVVEVDSDTRALASAEVEWRRGVTSRTPWWTHDTRVASYVIHAGDDYHGYQRLTGTLWANGVPRPVERAPRKVTLRPRAGEGPTIVLHTGRRLTFDIKNLPPQTHRIEVVTVGENPSPLRFTAPCHRHARSTTGR